MFTFSAPPAKEDKVFEHSSKQIFAGNREPVDKFFNNRDGYQ